MSGEFIISASDWQQKRGKISTSFIRLNINFFFLFRYHVVDAGVGRGVSDRLEGRAGSVGVGGRRHLPGEVHLCLVDARLVAALPHHRVFGVMGVAGGDAHQRVAGRRQRLLAALLGHLLDVVVVGQGHHLGRGEDVAALSSPDEINNP